MAKCKVIGIRLPQELADILTMRANQAKVKASTYAYAIVAASLQSSKVVKADPRAPGLGSADEETRSEVGRIGRASEGSAKGAGRKKSKKMD